MLAVGESIGTILYIAGLLLSAAALLSKKKQRAAPLDDAITTTATQGAYIPLVIGRQRVGPVVLFVEDLTPGLLQQSLQDPRAAGAAGGKGGGGSAGQQSYVEMSLHAICVGPASELRGIYQNNERIWSGTLTPATDPSGVSTYQVREPDGSSFSYFRIYWGFDDDPVIPELGASPRHGISTRYSHAVKILWVEKRLGQTRQWPRLEYEVVCPCYSSISTSPSEIPRTGEDTRPTWGDVDEAAGYTPDGYTDADQVELGVFGLEVIYSGPQTPGVSLPGPYPTLQLFPHSITTLPGIYGQIDPEWLAFFPTGGIIKLWLTGSGTSGFPGSPPVSQVGTVGAWRFFRIAESRVITDRPLFTIIGLNVMGFLAVTLGNEIPPSDLVLENVDLSPPSPPPVSPLHPSQVPSGYVRPLLTGNKDGINPIHLIDQILFARFPYGAARDRSKFDSYSIDVAAELMQAEKIRAGIAIENGESIESVLSAIMQDIGLMIPLNPETGKYTFRLVRYEGTGSVLDESILLRAPELVNVHGSRPIDVVAFTFKDRERNYREVPVKVQDNGQITESETVRAQKVTIEITNDRDSVSRIAPRRQQEALGNLSSIQFELNHRGFLTVPASRFSCTVVDDPNVFFIVTDVQRDVNSSKVVVETTMDTYDPEGGVEGGAQLPLDDPPALTDTITPVASLEDFFAIELPRMLADNPERVELFFGASRSAATTRYANVWVSRDGTTYELLGDAPIVARGVLSAELPADGPSIDEGVIGFTTTNDVDINAIEDLNLNEASWRAGRQVMLVGDEVIYLKNGYVTSPGAPSSGQLTGLIRGRAGSRAATHAPGTPFYVLLSHRVIRNTSELFYAGKELHYKLQATETRRIEPLDEIDAKTLTPTGRATTPPAPSALRLGSFQTSYRATDGDLTFVWSYHSIEFPQTGLGDQPCGAATGLSRPRGHFIVRIEDDAEQEVYKTIAPEPAFTLSAALRSSLDLDSTPPWTILVSHVEGSYTSEEASLTLSLDT